MDDVFIDIRRKFDAFMNHLTSDSASADDGFLQEACREVEAMLDTIKEELKA